MFSDALLSEFRRRTVRQTKQPKMSETIDVETVTTQTNQQPQTQALQRVESGAVGKAMSVEQLHDRLEFVRRVMKQEMRVDVDYGKIPGAGEKPTLLQPGAQKLLMTFNLREQIKKETLREYPDFHREYEFVVVVFPAGQAPQDGWDGVGTCSTLESKYRYRKAERRCPKCKKGPVIAEKPEFVKGRAPGFVCWKKKGGCGEVFHADHPDIISQSADDIENPDPADQWNTVRKMAFKRALVAAAINATNTSELWTQDVEDMNLDGSGAKRPGKAPTSAPATSTRPAAQSPGQPAKPAAAPPKNQTPAPAKKYATPATRDWMINELKDCIPFATEYFRKLANPSALMPNEELKDLGLEWVPVSRLQMKALQDALASFGNGETIRHPYSPNDLKPVEKPIEKPKAPAPKPAAPPTPAPAAAAPAPKTAPANGNKRDPDWFWDVICPVPHKGQKRDEYLKRPDTIRSLYTQLKEGDEEAGKRLWGFANHYDPKGWNDRPPSNADLVFREALDAFLEWHSRHGEDTHGQPEPEPQTDPEPEPEEDDVPF